MFRSVGREPSVVMRRGSCVLGSTDGPLAGSPPSPQTVAAIALGRAEKLPFIADTSSELVLRDACCIMAADDAGLLLARGPYGGRPLYYASEHADRVVVACSRLEPLVASSDQTHALNAERLGALIMSATGDPTATVYQGVSRLRSCTGIRFIGGGQTGWSRLPSWPDVRRGSVTDAAAELLERIAVAVDRSVDSFANVAVMASGGLDSSGLVATLASRPRILGFATDVCAVDFGGPGDDRPHLTSLSTRHGLQPHRIRPSDAASLVPSSFVVDGAPVVWPSAAPFILAGRRARDRGADAVLSGWGGDGLFDGDLGQFAERARAGDCIGAILDAAKLQLLWSSSPVGRVLNYVARPLLGDLLPHSWPASWRRLRVHRSREWHWAGGKLRSLMNVPAAAPDPDWRAELATSIEMDEAADERGQHEVAVGLPRIDPYLDAELIEFMASVPADMLFQGNRMRGLYRQAMEGILPDSLRLRPDKASFEPAIDELFDSAARDPAFQDLIKMEALADLGMVEPRRYREAVTRTMAGKSRRGWLEVWPALAVEAFVQQRRGAVPPRGELS
jgi:asparagine synthase (glutamine-hydrolysing)